jgi:nucleoside-diphosphate-sugar epimerase
MSDLHVIFGSGPLGKWTARELVRMGKAVRMVNHSGKAERLPAEVELVAGDANDIAKNVALTKGATAIYQCAQPHYYEWVAKFPAMQAAIVEAATANGAKLVVGDNLYMYGNTHGAPIREDLPYQPHTRKGRVRAEMANAILEAHRSGRVKAAIGRASDFFGPDDFAFTGYAIYPAAAGRAANLLGRLDLPHTFTYVADFGRLLATLGTHEEALGQVWFTPSSPPVTQKELIGMIEVELGRPVKTLAAGPGMMRFLGLFNKEIAETVEMMYEWTEPFVVDTSRAEKAFGWKATPLPDAIRATLDWCKQRAG